MDRLQHPRRAFLKEMALSIPAFGSFLAVQEAFGETLRRRNLSELQPHQLREMRDEYMLAPEVTYLNHASIGTIPRLVHDAHVQYLQVNESNPWLHMWGGAWEEPVASVRNKGAQLMRCSATDVALLHNTTEAFNLLANGLPLGRGDEVVFSSLNHVGASRAFFHMSATRGFEVKRFPFPLLDTPSMSPEDVLDLYDRRITSKTRLLVFPHIDNIVGLRHPVKALARLARDRGVQYVAVDAAQTVGMIPLDVADYNVDIYATSPHKWLQSPKGLGLSYIGEPIREDLRPMWVTWGQNLWGGQARLYEDYGTRNLPEVLTLGHALDFQETIGEEVRDQRLRALFTFTKSLVDENASTVWRSPLDYDLCGSLYAVQVKGKDSRDLAEKLFEQFGFVFRPFNVDGLNAIRLSPNVFNTEDEIVRLFDHF